MSTYMFDRRNASDAGPFWQNHVRHPAGLWA